MVEDKLLVTSTDGIQLQTKYYLSKLWYVFLTGIRHLGICDDEFLLDVANIGCTPDPIYNRMHQTSADVHASV